MNGSKQGARYTSRYHAARNLLLEDRWRYWDMVPEPGVGIEDLAAGSLSHFRKRAEHNGRIVCDASIASDAALLDKLGLYDGDSLKWAALLLFGKDPERFVTRAFLEIASFRGNGEILGLRPRARC